MSTDDILANNNEEEEEGIMCNYHNKVIDINALVIDEEDTELECHTGGGGGGGRSSYSPKKLDINDIKAGM